MNEEIATLLDDVSQRVQHAIQARDCPAIVAVRGDQTVVLSDYDYLRDTETAEAFQQRAALKALEVGATQWVFAVPQVVVLAESGLATRPVSNLPLREGEEEAIVWMSFDAEDGVDYGLVPYTRRPNGEPIFDDAEVFDTAARPGEAAPGWTMLHTFLEHQAPDE